jgi:hypothetical protein
MAPQDSELLAAVKASAQDFQHLPPAKCREAVDELLNLCEQREADLPPEVCKALVQFVLSVASLRCADHRPLQWSCLEVLRQAGRSTRAYETPANRADLHNFFLRLAKKEAKGQPTFKPRVLLLLLQYVLRWAFAADLAGVLAAEGDGALKVDVVTALIEALYGEMGRCHRWPPRWQLKCSRALSRVLRAYPQLAEHGVAWLRKADEAPGLLVAALGALVIASPDFASSQKGALVETYVKQVLEVKKELPAYTLESWGPVLALVSAEELEKQVLPVAVRMVKRNPAAIAVSMPSLLSHLTPDLSKHAKEVLDPLALDLLKDKEKRPRGRRLVQQTARRSAAEPLAAVALAEAWAEAAKKTGKADEKQALLMAIHALIGSLPQEAVAAAAEELVRLADAKGPIAKLAGEDANEETRGLGYRVMGALLSHLPAAAHEPVVKELSKPLEFWLVRLQLRP